MKGPRFMGPPGYPSSAQPPTGKPPKGYTVEPSDEEIPPPPKTQQQVAEIETTTAHEEAELIIDSLAASAMLLWDGEDAEMQAYLAKRDRLIHVLTAAIRWQDTGRPVVIENILLNTLIRLRSKYGK